MSTDVPPAHDQPAPRTSGRDVLILFAVLCGLVLALSFGPRRDTETPPEPVDASTRYVCRDWQVVVAITGVDELDTATRPQRLAALEAFFPRAEAAAAVKDSEQARFLAIVEAISGARRLRDAAGPATVRAALNDFEADLVEVTSACEQT